MSTSQTQKGMTKLVPIIVVVAVLIAGGAYYTMSNKSQAPATTPTAPTAAAEPATPITPSAGITVNPPTATTPASGFKDGTYTAEGSYQTPELVESISVTLTLKDGVVEDSSIQQQAKDQKSSLYQDVFASDYKTFVVGKKISDVNVGVVSGSSLTGKGFNEAVAKIMDQAKA